MLFSRNVSFRTNLWKTLWKRTSKVVKKSTWLWKSRVRKRGQIPPPRLSTGVYTFEQFLHRIIHRRKVQFTKENTGFPQVHDLTTTTTSSYYELG